MIYTVTFNPALDYVLGLDQLEHGMTNRSEYEYILPGGKGLNVSSILNNLGIDNTALGFIAGFTGDEIERLFTLSGGKSSFIKLTKGNSRINVKIKADKETEINASGPDIDASSLNKLLEKIYSLTPGDILVLAGSIPHCLPSSLYSDILSVLEGKGVMCVVDATKDLLMNVLKYKPFLIKPNNHELGELFGVKLKARTDVIPYAKKLIDFGALNVLVSMAGEGAVLITSDGDILESGAPKGVVKNSVGAGDSMVAGFIAGWCESHDYKEAFKLGISSGSASAFSEKLATRDEIYTVYKQLEI